MLQPEYTGWWHAYLQEEKAQHDNLESQGSHDHMIKNLRPHLYTNTHIPFAILCHHLRSGDGVGAQRNTRDMQLVYDLSVRP